MRVLDGIRLAAVHVRKDVMLTRFFVSSKSLMSMLSYKKARLFSLRQVIVLLYCSNAAETLNLRARRNRLSMLSREEYS